MTLGVDCKINFHTISQKSWGSYKLPAADTILKSEINLIKQQESITCSSPLVEHNKSELYEWGELFPSPFSEAQRRGGQPLKSWDKVTHRD